MFKIAPINVNNNLSIVNNVGIIVESITLPTHYGYSLLNVLLTILVLIFKVNISLNIYKIGILNCYFCLTNFFRNISIPFAQD